MHLSAIQNAKRFYTNYLEDLSSSPIVIDFGCGAFPIKMRDIFGYSSKYIGIDMTPSPAVDIVCENRNTPFSNQYADAIISTSCFEHDDFFWMTFLEMCRVLKPGGFIYINAPSAGPYHGCPGDSWRFYKDSWAALAKWANEHKYPLELKESYIDTRGVLDIDGNNWNDSVGIFYMNHPTSAETDK
jgi:predicted SAM-dependent methyltransferase